MHKTLITAHRGDSQSCPENTLEAFLKAREVGADAIEMDVRRTKDNVLVVIHDDNIQGKLVRELDLKEIKELSSGMVPTLEEVTQLAARSITMEVELKEKGYEKDVVELLLRYCDVREFRIISFNQNSLKRIKSLNNNIIVGLIVGTESLNDLKKLFGLLTRLDCNYDCLNLDYRYWKYNIVRLLPSKNKKVFLWTVDSRDLAKRIMKDSDVVGIVTNIPEELILLRNSL